MTIKEYYNLREAMSNLDTLSIIDNCSTEVAEAIDKVWDLIDEIKTGEV